jgi:peptide deformylase
MILPIHVYGHEALRRETERVTENTDALQSLIDDMIETMYAAHGLGLAAPQVGRTERLFVADVTPLREEIEAEGEAVPAEQPMVFINPEIVWMSDEEVGYEEGCLSIPDVRADVKRPERIRMRYLDRHFEAREMEVGSALARVLQHEFDHLMGVLFIDHLSAFRRRLLRRTLRRMAEGDVEAAYPLLTRDGATVA